MRTEPSNINAIVCAERKPRKGGLFIAPLCRAVVQDFSPLRQCCARGRAHSLLVAQRTAAAVFLAILVIITLSGCSKSGPDSSISSSSFDSAPADVKQLWSDAV